MIGTVSRLRKRGVDAGAIGSLTAAPGARVQIYRVVDGRTVILATGTVLKSVGGKLRINYESHDSHPAVRVGDMVRSV